MRKFLKEFKTFISKGNVFDMAVGMVIATAFNKIVSSMVNDIIMPLVTYLTGASSLDQLSVLLRESYDKTGKLVQLTWNYGKFLQTVLDFLIIAFSVFLMVKVVLSSRKKFKEIGEFVSTETKEEVKLARKEARRICKCEHRKYKEVWAELEAERKAKIEAELAAQKAEEELKQLEERKNNPTSEDLLKEIRDLLKEQTNN